uniref:Fibrinogen C-terminal domain-containing protein n=1 Tax=Amphimedon queenslandica TaxID=400682 RepID=A0A1X7VIT9_AMPQE
MTNAGGGWLVILRLREWPVQADSNSLYFERYYHPDNQQGDYQRGFGSLYQNFWFDLNKLYKLANRSNVYAQARFKFTEDKTGTEYWVEYDTFAIAPKTSNYSPTIRNYTGGNLPDIFSVLNGSTFKPGNITCHHNFSWWYPKFDPHKYRPCRCLISFVISKSGAVSRFMEACLGPPFDHLTIAERFILADLKIPLLKQPISSFMQ